MKRITIACFLALALAFVACKKAKEDLQGGVITFSKGIVKIYDKDGKEKELKQDTFLLPEYKIETGKDSYADIQLAEGVLIRVKENTSLILKKVFVDSANGTIFTDLGLNKGKIFSKVGSKLDKTSQFNVTTPTVVASVRGTEFIVEETGKGTSTRVGDGSVEVTDLDNPEKQATAESGEEVSADGKDLKEDKLTEDEVKELQDDSATIQSITEEQRARIQEILKDFQENKALILQGLEDQKARNRELIEGAKDENRRLLEEAKSSGQAEKEAIKKAAQEDKEKVKSSIDDAKKELENQRKSLKDQAAPK
ncbi:transcriptional regulator [Leptospira wolffii]|uniref:Transcriptional regulator n=1 Tax=Leptospira wolffii TaxID=409998 RepID=A0A2M9Z6T8_9LEPT|nr:FecR domain-containing protein [Leptospira wolffii]PJZ64140.1 transcriptional regulator [Leptospira wolffii]TGK56872.1 transcriptional regulator [Leptospira wolffii]TGK71546.1 transcriptional regulator [Leptospira wolffii]TGK75598.1 transcriptional regulator [Leptospira wolffii]TGL32913.1 transcriptional regulator [Leptospira wolffii]